MRKRTLFIVILFLLMIGPAVCLAGAEDKEPDPQNYKRVEDLIDDAIKDLATPPQEKAEIAMQPPVTESVPLEKEEHLEVIDLEFNTANIEDVLRLIAEASGRNIVLDPALQGKKIELHLKKVSPDQALQLLYSAYSLNSTKIGDILFISTQEKIKKDTFQTKVRQLRNINVNNAKDLVDNLVTTINLSEETNTIVLIGAADDVAKAEMIIDKVDVPQPQVILEAKIIEINNDALLDLGIDWSDQISITTKETTRPSTFSTTTTVEDSLFHFYKFARTAIQFDMIIKMLEYENKAKVLSNPRVTTMNNKEAEIFIGDKIPYTITLVSGGALTTEVRFVEPGIRLKITPTIIEKDFVVIKIEPEVSYIYSWRGAGDAYPWIKSRQALANVRVENNQPFVLGGLLSNEDKKNLYRVPYLGRIPLLGNLFSWEKTTLYNTDLIISVTPTIITKT